MVQKAPEKENDSDRVNQRSGLRKDVEVSTSGETPVEICQPQGHVRLEGQRCVE